MTAVVEQRVVGRFAPSPTGPLHLGSLVAALGSYLMARRVNGRWLVRMEDLDLPRVVPGMADDILRTLEQLGFDWDGPVIRQSSRGEAYAAALDRLAGSQHLYPCGCSRAEIAQMATAPHPGEEGPAYPGICRTELGPGKIPRSFRLRVDERPVLFVDQVMGEYSQILVQYCGDFVVRRADGIVSYHLAVVVDDAECGVNQVVRGADLLSSTPRQIYLQQLLGYPCPDYCHLPLVFGPFGNKLSKRDNAVSLAQGFDLQRKGGALLANALRFLGQNPPSCLDHASAEEVLTWGVNCFDPASIPRESAPFIAPENICPGD